LNIFQGKWAIESHVLVNAVINAITSNNFLKLIYGVSFGDKTIRKPLILSFGAIIISGLLFSFFM